MNIETEMPQKKDKGFTLVELLIVIVILGVLATVTVFAVRGITNQGQTSACAADKKTLEVATESYFAQNAVTSIPAFDGPDTDAVATVGEALVKAGLLRSVSTKYTVVDDGTLTAINPCT